MNVLYLIVQATIALGVFFTILLNGKDYLYGWLLGAVIQLLQATYGLVTNQWGYLLAIVPCVAFVAVFVHKLRVPPKPFRLVLAEYLDSHNYLLVTTEEYTRLRNGVHPEQQGQRPTDNGCNHLPQQSD